MFSQTKNSKQSIKFNNFIFFFISLNLCFLSRKSQTQIVVLRTLAVFTEPESGLIIFVFSVIIEDDLSFASFYLTVDLFSEGIEVGADHPAFQSVVGACPF